MGASLPLRLQPLGGSGVIANVWLMIYKWIGRAVVVYVTGNMRQRYGRQIKIGAGIGLVAGVAAIGTAVYLAARNVPEG